MDKLLIIVVSVLLLAGCSATQKVNIQPDANIGNQEIPTSSDEVLSESTSSDELLALDDNGLNNFMPMSRGSYWLYKVTGEEQGEQAIDGKESPTIKTDKQVKIEVLKYIKRDSNLQAAFLSGYPGMYEGKSTLIIVADKGYYLVQGEEVFNRISNTKDDLTDLYFEDFLILPIPLTINKKFGCMDNSMDREDNYYCYWVESIKPADTKLYRDKNQYQISFHTLPDVTNTYYVDGVGVTGFDYHHNGTLVEEKWELIKYFIK